MKSHSELVKEFTEESKNIKVPERPTPMSYESTKFLAKMMMSEIVEMLETYEPRAKALVTAKQLLDEDFAEKEALNRPAMTYPLTDEQKIADQMDAMVDSYYYSLDSAAKHGMNLEPIFQAVHQANMNKRNPETGKFERRADNKVIKPPGWVTADIDKIVNDQITNGSWMGMGEFPN